jgi:hypothetical protein
VIQLFNSVRYPVDVVDQNGRAFRPHACITAGTLA